MPETYVVTKVKFAGEKDNPHGGKLFKFYVSLHGQGTQPGSDTDFVHDVYWQRKSRELNEGEEVYGHIEQGEYGPRFKTDQRPGNFQAPKYERAPDNSDRSRRIERQHSQEMAIRTLALFADEENFGEDSQREGGPPFKDLLKEWTDWFAKDLDVDVGGGKSLESTAHPAADVSAEEASPPQKRKLTTLFNKAGLAKDAQRAIVLYRCRQIKATKDGASRLIQDLVDGATAEALLAEIADASSKGDEVAIEASKLIPSDVPWEDDGSLPPAPAEKDESDVPF
jgi:hypothetical protein